MHIWYTSIFRMAVKYNVGYSRIDCGLMASSQQLRNYSKRVSLDTVSQSIS